LWDAVVSEAAGFRNHCIPQKTIALASLPYRLLYRQSMM